MRSRGAFVVVRFNVLNRSGQPIVLLDTQLVVGAQRFNPDAGKEIFFGGGVSGPLAAGRSGPMVRVFDIPAQAARRLPREGALAPPRRPQHVSHAALRHDRGLDPPARRADLPTATGPAHPWCGRRRTGRLDGPGARRRDEDLAAHVPRSHEAPPSTLRPSGVHRSGVERVDRDPASGERASQRSDHLMHGALADRVGQLLGHRPEVLAGGEQHHPAIRSSGVPVGGEACTSSTLARALTAQQRSSSSAVSDARSCCELRAWFTTRTSTAPNASSARSISRPGAAGSPRSAARCSRRPSPAPSASITEPGAPASAPPGLLGVMRHPGMRPARRTVGQQTLAHREADPRPAADAGHHTHAILQRAVRHARKSPSCRGQRVGRPAGDRIGGPPSARVAAAIWL